MKFSVIIPVYNVEHYLEECLDSILAQEYTDYDVLLINDGSADSSGEICARYAEKDSRFKVFHQPNKGVSAARNLGLEHAAGEWICFIDSDDLVEAHYLTAFAENISGDSDLLLQGAKRIGKVNDVFCFFENLETISKERFFNHYRIWPHYFSVWGKAFKRTVIAQKPVHFDKSVHYAEDTLFNLDYALQMTGKFTVIPDINYKYRFNFEGLAVKEVGFYKRRELLVRIHHTLQKLTTNRTDFYPYCVAALRTLYLDRNVINTAGHLNLLLKDYKPEVLKIYESENLTTKIIALLIKFDHFYILDKIFKFAYRKNDRFGGI